MNNHVKDYVLEALCYEGNLVIKFRRIAMILVRCRYYERN